MKMSTCPNQQHGHLHLTQYIDTLPTLHQLNFHLIQTRNANNHSTQHQPFPQKLIQALWDNDNKKITDLHRSTENNLNTPIQGSTLIGTAIAWNRPNTIPPLLKLGASPNQPSLYTYSLTPEEYPNPTLATHSTENDPIPHPTPSNKLWETPLVASLRLNRKTDI